MSDLVLQQRHKDGIVILTLNRPEARNALSRALVEQLLGIIGTLSDDERLRAVVIAGAGDRAFCAGADLIERQAMSTAERGSHTDRIRQTIDSVASLPVPVIAAIRGFALAGGSELALACDLRIGAEDAVLGFPEVRIGIFPGAGGVLRLPRIVGAALAADLLFTGRRVTSEEAYRIGLLDLVVTGEVLMNSAVDKAKAIAENAPLAVRAVKKALRASIDLPDREARDIVDRERRALDATEDYAEGLRAFAERRPAEFNGR